MNNITSCEVCGSAPLNKVLDLGLHPLCDDLKHVSSSEACKEFPIEIVYCSNCRTAFQSYQVPKVDLFPASYHYRSRFTADVLTGMHDLVSSVKSSYGSLKDKSVLDIGCNDGSLLSFFREEGAITYGIEPTSAAADATEQGHTVLSDYFTPQLADHFRECFGAPDIITFTNVFAHIENLPELLNAVSRLMSNSTILVIENHYLGSVLERSQFDTFYHEHPRTYSASSFRFIANSLNRSLLALQFPARYGGNIRVIIGNGNQESWILPAINSTIYEKESIFESHFKSMALSIPLWINKKTQEINDLVSKYGPIRAKAFPGRAAIMIKLLNLDSESIKCCYEKPGSMKINHSLPGTSIPIFCDSIFDLTDDAPILNLAWHISSEINLYMRSRGFNGSIIDIFSPSDFSR